MKKFFLLFAMLIILASTIYADSPLTSTDFYRAYLDVPLVKKAAGSPGKLTKEMMEYLRNDNNPLDKRIALVNAVGWYVENQSTLRDYIEFCYDKYELENGITTDTAMIVLDEPYIETVTPDNTYDFSSDEEVVVVEEVVVEEIDGPYMSQTVIENATPEQLAVLVYLQAMSDYADTQNNYAFMEYAMQTPLLNRQSFMLPMGLILAQTALDIGDLGNIYPAMHYYLFSPEIQDMRPEAIEIIMDYIDLYKEYADRQ